MFQIDKNVPAPLSGRNRLYPWGELEPGDSFFVPGRTTRNIGGAIGQARNRYPDWEIVARTVTENGVKGVRVWRVE